MTATTTGARLDLRLASRDKARIASVGVGSTATARLPDTSSEPTGIPPASSDRVVSRALLSRAQSSTSPVVTLTAAGTPDDPGSA